MEVAQEKKVLKRYELDITKQEGQKVVEIPDEILNNANHLWEDYLIGKFLDTAPHIVCVHAIVNKIWQGGKSQQIDVQEVDATTMKFKVSNSLMRARILRRGMWNIGNIPLIVTKWTPDELKEKPEVKSIPLWVYLKNVPMNMYSWQGISFIVSEAGFPVRLHPEMASCSNFKLAKIFVNADLTKELPRKINFTKDGKSSLVEFIYPWLPTRCNTCGKWGHEENACVMNKKDGVGLADQMEKQREDVEKTKDEIEKASDEIEKAMDKILVHKKNGVNGNEVELNEIEEGQIVEGWSDVLPGKVNRNQSPLKFGQVKIMTPLRFSALNEINDNGELVNKDEIKEDTEANKVEKGGSEAEQFVAAESQEVATESQEVVERKDDEIGNSGGKNKVLVMEKKVEGNVNNEDVSQEEHNAEVREVDVVKDDMVITIEEKEIRKPSYSDVLGVRPSIPRATKTHHRIIPEPMVGGKHMPGNLGKRSTRTPTQ